jgi:hypothetical protein
MHVEGAPIKIGGALTGADYISYAVNEVQNQHSVDRGYAVGIMKNGDKYLLRYEGTATMNGNIPEHLEGNWTLPGRYGTAQAAARQRNLYGTAAGGWRQVRPRSESVVQMRSASFLI